MRCQLTTAECCRVVSEPLPPVCILAGGVGTRLGSRVEKTPKPLLDVAGEPFLIHQLRLLARHRATRVVLCVGYLGELIERRIGSSQFGIAIGYAYDGPAPIGTLGAIRQALPALGERFLVLYGDTYLRIDYGAVAGEWRRSGLLGDDDRSAQSGSMGRVECRLRRTAGDGV